MGYLTGFRSVCGILETGADVQTRLRSAGNWVVETSSGNMSAPIIANSADAGCAEIAYCAATAPVGMVLKRRTARTIDPGEPFTDWPPTTSLDETWYFGPKGGGLLISPVD